MNKKQLLLLIIGGIGIFFLISMILSSEFFVNSFEKEKENYLSKKEFKVNGKVLEIAKASARNKLFKIKPNSIQNRPLPSLKNTIGFIAKDSASVFIIAKLPKGVKNVDSISYNTDTDEVLFFINSIQIGQTEPELLRWNTMQHLRLRTEQSERIDLDYLY